MKSFSEEEYAVVKKVLFKWLSNNDPDISMRAADNLFKLEEVSEGIEALQNIVKVMVNLKD